MSNMSQDLNDSWYRNVSYPCWPDEQPWEWTKILVLSTISILTLIFNSIILIAVLSMNQKVVTRILTFFQVDGYHPLISHKSNIKTAGQNSVSISHRENIVVKYKGHLLHVHYTVLVIDCRCLLSSIGITVKTLW